MHGETSLREIKAYIRPERLDAVVHALEGLGVCQITIVEVKALAKCFLLRPASHAAIPFMVRTISPDADPQDYLHSRKKEYAHSCSRG